MAEAQDLQKAVGSGDGAWFALADSHGRGQLRGADGSLSGPESASVFTPTVFLYDNFPGGVGLSEPLWRRQKELLERARGLLAACDCRGGCPACVGPILASDEDSRRSPKDLAARVLALLVTA
jgi:DEAD/DEAH box helicase domain-containing protein